ncbi:MAG: CoA activase, partial [Deltaproteobacteria bacterium]|nr:CoA activase [Deltaproteobacteria bacterium]
MNNVINKKLYIGLDVGSTTVKAVVMDDNETILWKDYRRHNARQPESVLAFLQEIESAFEGSSMYLFTTGNGGRSLGEYINGLHVQEVNAVTLAVEKLHPRAGSAVELGGQDAKVIIWKKDSRGQKTSISYMNDKCAGGTGATLDKIFSKLQLTREAICNIRAAKELNIHHIAAKCGVFAETDVIGLIKAGVSDEEIVVSLCTAVVKQNIEVLLHGNPLGDDVILLGGPHTYIKAFSDVWRNLLPETWEIHKFRPKDKPMEELVYVPENAQYFAAIGSIIFGKEQEGVHKHSVYTGADRLIEFINEGKSRQLEALGEVLPPLATDENEVAAFAKEYGIPRFIEPEIEKGSIVDVYLGVDGGSTSSKLVIIDSAGELIYKDYVLSKGNPIVDLRVMFQNILDWEKRREFSLNIIGTGVTGYASDILQKAFSIDTAVVETVAHLKSAQNYYGDPDVICDVGGQDIKVMTMKHGRVVDIRLNTQCSAGNGYFLQAMADQFEVPVEKYAEHAFLARKAPSFNYGCAVFMEQDKVNFQQLGWTKDEIMAGLAHVLPLNIWNYVVQETNIAKLGTKFILQGGTQKNLAALKAQVDFIKKKVDGADVYCHKYAEVAGAVGAAIEAKQKVKQSVFVGLKDAVNVSFISKNDDSTRCRFCSNQCPRTFIDIQKEDG